MSINRELNEEELKHVIDSPMKSDDLPEKFKQMQKSNDELDEGELNTVYGGPIPVEKLPDWAYTDKNKSFSEK